MPSTVSVVRRSLRLWTLTPTHSQRGGSWTPRSQTSPRIAIAGRRRPAACATTWALIEATAPEPGEDAELSARAERLANAEELRIAASQAHGALSNEVGEPDVTALLAEARRVLERASDSALTDIAAALADIGYRITDLAAQLSAYLADLDETGPHELAAVEERRAALGVLIRAHGSLEQALELWQSGSARLAELDDDGDRLERLEAERDAARLETRSEGEDPDRLPNLCSGEAGRGSERGAPCSRHARCPTRGHGVAGRRDDPWTGRRRDPARAAPGSRAPLGGPRARREESSLA